MVKDIWSWICVASYTCLTIGLPGEATGTETRAHFILEKLAELAFSIHLPVSMDSALAALCRLGLHRPLPSEALQTRKIQVSHAWCLQVWSACMRRGTGALRCWPQWPRHCWGTPRTWPAHQPPHPPLQRWDGAHTIHKATVSGDLNVAKCVLHNAHSSPS